MVREILKQSRVLDLIAKNVALEERTLKLEARIAELEHTKSCDSCKHYIPSGYCNKLNIEFSTFPIHKSHFSCSYYEPKESK
jgi:hypothetical protein